MIEINLVPDVKQELLAAERQRSVVISIAILASIAFISLVTLLALYVYAVQTVRFTLADNAISREGEKLAKVEDLANTLTVQNQLAKLSEMHSSKQITSRLFEILTTIDPPAPNNMTISNLKLDTDVQTVTIEGFAAGGYSALEIFKKTIEATTLHYTDEGQAAVKQLANRVDIVETSYGENSDGNRVLRFTISFEYPEETFARNDARLFAPNRENATDSFKRIPQSLFGDQASDEGGN